MTDTTHNTLSADLLLTGTADQIMEAKSAILRLERDHPGLTIRGRMHIEISADEFVGQKAPADMTIEDLLLLQAPVCDPRTLTALKRGLVNTVEELTMKTEDDLLAIPNFGGKCLNLVKENLSLLGLKLKP